MATDKSQQGQQTISESLAGITHGIKRLGVLYFEKARLKTTEKITILLATIAFTAVITALGLVFFVFVSIGVGHYLATSIAPHLAYLIVAAFYLLIFLLALAMRRRLFVDPISRFMSRLLVEEPEEDRAKRLMAEENEKNNAAHREDKDEKDILKEKRHIDEELDSQSADEILEEDHLAPEKGGTSC